MNLLLRYPRNFFSLRTIITRNIMFNFKSKLSRDYPSIFFSMRDFKQYKFTRMTFVLKIDGLTNMMSVKTKSIEL